LRSVKGSEIDENATNLGNEMKKVVILAERQ